MPFIADSFNEKPEQDQGCDNIDALQKCQSQSLTSTEIVPVTTNSLDWPIGPITYYLFNAFDDSEIKEDFVDEDIVEGISREVDLIFLEIMAHERGYTQGFEDAVRICQQKDRFEAFIDELKAFDAGYQAALDEQNRAYLVSEYARCDTKKA